jgi:cell division protein FtsW
MQAKKSIDKILFITVLVLCGFGIIAVFGASTEIADSYYGNRFHFLTRQIVWFLGGLFVLFFFQRSSLEAIRLLSKLLLLVCVILLILVYPIGVEVKGATRWLNLGFMNLQPSTITQFVVVIFTADYISRKHDELENFSTLYPLLAVVILLGGLIAFQPDFSTAAMLGFTVVSILFVSSTSFKNIGTIIFSGLGLAIPILLLEPYRRQRIMSWFTGSEAHAQETNWQSIQSVTSFGLGGLSGTGLGQSKQKLFFLPEAHTDYILAIVGEELGFLGVFFIMSLFLILIWRGFKIASRATTLFHYYLASGLSIYIGLYAFINILVVIGLLPTTGLPLPFISYGGSQLLVNMACIGILLNISTVTHDAVFRREEDV